MIKIKSFLLFVILLISITNIKADNISNRNDYNVGFKRYYVFDDSRKYPLLYEPGKNYDTTLYKRPMIVNVWYPAIQNKNSKTEKYTEYLNFENPDTLWTVFLKRIKNFNLTTIKENAFRYTELNDTLVENSLFDSLFNTDALIIKNAIVAKGRFPLVVYQQSLGGTIEENAFLLRYIASHGYVVVNCAYQSNSGKLMHPDWNLERSENDVRFLLNFAKSKSNLNFIDTSNIHLLGFSFGAQSNFNIVTKYNSIKSLVSLDSRLEYFYDYNVRGYGELPKYLLTNYRKINIPTLLFTNQEAPYIIIDSLKNSDRFYIMVKDYEHYDFCSIKAISNLMVYKKILNSKLLQKWDNFQYISEYIVDFYDFYSKNEFKNKCYNIQNKNKNQFYIEKIIKERGIDLSFNNKNISHRQVLFSLLTKEIIDVKNSLKKNNILISETMYNEFAYYLVSLNRINKAEDILNLAVEYYPKSSNLYDSLGEIYFMEKKYNKSLENFKKSLELNPNNNNALKYIEQIKLLN